LIKKLPREAHGAHHLGDGDFDELLGCVSAGVDTFRSRSDLSTRTVWFINPSPGLIRFQSVSRVKSAGRFFCYWNFRR